MSPNSKRANRMASRTLALLLATTCAGCGSFPKPVPLDRDLPPAPALFSPVGVPGADLNDDARAKLARTRDALAEANRRLAESRVWYDGVRESYGTKP